RGPGRLGRARTGRGDAAAHHPRDPPPARVRPRGAGGGEGDVRAAAAAAAHLPRDPWPGGAGVTTLIVGAVGAIVVAFVLTMFDAAIGSASRVAAEEADSEGRRGAAQLREILADSAGP